MWCCFASTIQRSAHPPPTFHPRALYISLSVGSHNLFIFLPCDLGESARNKRHNSYVKFWLLMLNILFKIVQYSIKFFASNLRLFKCINKVQKPYYYWQIVCWEKGNSSRTRGYGHRKLTSSQTFPTSLVHTFIYMYYIHKYL